MKISTFILIFILLALGITLTLTLNTSSSSNPNPSSIPPPSPTSPPPPQQTFDLGTYTDFLANNEFIENKYESSAFVDENVVLTLNTPQITNFPFNLYITTTPPGLAMQIIECSVNGNIVIPEDYLTDESILIGEFQSNVDSFITFLFEEPITNIQVYWLALPPS
jgi:hypothetical protein